jgi:hypothetical protein
VLIQDLVNVLERAAMAAGYRRWTLATRPAPLYFWAGWHANAD